MENGDKDISKPFVKNNFVEKKSVTLADWWEKLEV